MSRSGEVAIVSSTVPATLDRFHRELIHQLGQHFDVHVVSSPGKGLANLARDLPVVTHPLTMTRSISPVADLLALIRWVRLVRRVRPQAIITATPKASLLGQLAARLTGVPNRLYYVGGLRLEGARGFERWVLSVMERLTCSAATAVMANSASLFSLIKDLRLAPAHKLHQTFPGSSHGVDSAYYFPKEPDPELAASLGLDMSVPVVGFVGRLTRDKGVDVLAEALAQLREQGVPAQLLVVGPQDEPDSARCLRVLDRSGVHTIYVPVVNDVRPYYSLMTLNVLPSRREGFPNVVLEASAMGIPTVTTSSTGAIDSVRDGETGSIVPVDDPRALAGALGRLLADAELREKLGALARQWVESDFQPVDVVRSLLAPVLATNA